MISIHVPAWGTTETRHCIYLSMPYFNPRSRVGNDKFAIIVCVCIIISIHVPAWGTTYTVCYIFKCFTISIHVPAWGTTGRLLPDGQQTAISIHVPAWGTTIIIYTFSPSRFYFNPRSRVGNDSKFSQIFFAFLCNKYNFSTFYYPFSLFFGVIRFTFLIFVVRILPIFYVYF